MNIRQSGKASLVLLLACAPIRAQEGPLDRLDANRARVSVSVHLDRSVYFPGELGELTITVQNPTSEVLEIPKPFVEESGNVVLLQKGGVIARAYGLEYGSVSPEPYRVDATTGGQDRQATPTVTIRGGERMVRTLQFFEKALGNSPESSVIVFGSAPPTAGAYRVVYWGAQADFRVVQPVFEGYVKIELRDTEEVQTADASPTRVGLRAYAFVLAGEGKHYLCVQRVPYPHDAEEPRTDEHGRLLHLGLPFSRYARVAESEEPFESLRGESDAAGGITLYWGAHGARQLHLTRDEWRIAGLKFGE